MAGTPMTPFFFNDAIPVEDGHQYQPLSLATTTQGSSEDDDDPRKFLHLLGIILPNSNMSSNSLNDIIADIHLSQPVSEEQILTFIVSVMGLVLNCMLLVVVFCARRAAWRLRNQRLFVALLASAYAILCFVIIAEVILLKLDAARFLVSCLILFKSRTVKKLCQFLVMGSVLGCAIDNYLAVCKPILHRIYTSRISNYFAASCAVYCVAATLLALADFILPLDLETNCTSTSPALSRDLQGVFFSFAYLRSGKDLETYCRNIEDCHITSTLEISVLVCWVTIAVPVSYFYIKTAMALRGSLTNLFAPLSVQVTPRSSAVNALRSSFGSHRASSAPNSFAKMLIRRRSSAVRRSSNGDVSLPLERNCSFGSTSTKKPPVTAVPSIPLSSILEQNTEIDDQHQKHPPSITSRSCRIKVTDDNGEVANLNDQNSAEAGINMKTCNDNNSSKSSSNQGTDDDEDESPRLSVPKLRLSLLDEENNQRRSSIGGPRRQGSTELRVRISSSNGDGEDVSLSTLSPNCRTSDRRNFSFMSFLGSNGLPPVNTERRVSVSQAQTLHLLRNRRRSSNTQIIILAIFIATWIPEITFQISNKLFFTEQFRTEYLPKLLPVVKYFDFFILLNAVIDPLLYGAAEVQKMFSRFFKRRSTV